MCLRITLQDIFHKYSLVRFNSTIGLFLVSSNYDKTFQVQMNNFHMLELTHSYVERILRVARTKMVQTCCSKRRKNTITPEFFFDVHAIRVLSDYIVQLR